jgi:hypothetical protein
MTGEGRWAHDRGCQPLPGGGGDHPRRGRAGPARATAQARGARVLRWAAIELAPAADSRPLASLARLGDFDWVVSAPTPREVVAERSGCRPRCGSPRSAAPRPTSSAPRLARRSAARALRRRGSRREFRVPAMPRARVLLPASAIAARDRRRLTALARTSSASGLSHAPAALDAERAAPRSPPARSTQCLQLGVGLAEAGRSPAELLAASAAVSSGRRRPARSSRAAARPTPSVAAHARRSGRCGRARARRAAAARRGDHRNALSTSSLAADPSAARRSGDR